MSDIDDDARDRFAAELTKLALTMNVPIALAMASFAKVGVMLAVHESEKTGLPPDLARVRAQFEQGIAHAEEELIPGCNRTH